MFGFHLVLLMISTHDSIHSLSAKTRWTWSPMLPLSLNHVPFASISLLHLHFHESPKKAIWYVVRLMAWAGLRVQAGLGLVSWVVSIDLISNRPSLSFYVYSMHPVDWRIEGSLCIDMAFPLYVASDVFLNHVTVKIVFHSQYTNIHREG